MFVHFSLIFFSFKFRIECLKLLSSFLLVGRGTVAIQALLSRCLQGGYQQLERSQKMKEGKVCRNICSTSLTRRSFILILSVLLSLSLSLSLSHSLFILYNLTSTITLELSQKIVISASLILSIINPFLCNRLPYIIS